MTSPPPAPRKTNGRLRASPSQSPPLALAHGSPSPTPPYRQLGSPSSPTTPPYRQLGSPSSPTTPNARRSRSRSTTPPHPSNKQKTYTKRFDNKKDFDREVRNCEELRRVDPSQKHFIYGSTSPTSSLELTMPYGGQNMLNRMTTANKHPFEKVVSWIGHVADAIAILIDHNLAHQDIRMPNIIVDDHDHTVAKVIDFNIMVKYNQTNHILVLKDYVIDAETMEDITLSPYYPPFYYKDPNNFVKYLENFTVYSNVKPGELLQLYLHVHGLTKDGLLSKAKHCTLDLSHVDGYSLGIIMLECYLMMKVQLNSKDANLYLSVARGLTDLNSPLHPREVRKLLQS